MNLLTVSDIIELIKTSLESQFRSLAIQGEVTNLSRSNTGHIYFSLSDADSMINCALFKMDAYRNPYTRELKNGDKVKVLGNIGVYSKRGTFQVIVKQITKLGAGDLKEQFEQLKKSLAASGLFDLEHKKEIPRYPKRVAVITSPEGAAFQDFINIYDRRSLWMDILLIPALVQGEKAPESLRKALYNVIDYHLNKAPEDKKIDVIVLTRGGGSLEDLWAFNDEALAWDIHNCPIPLISAVGHEVDFSISDMVADRRSETPSAAAEMLTESQSKLADSLRFYQASLSKFSNDLVMNNRQRLQSLGPFQNLSLIQEKVARYRNELQRVDLINRPYEFTGYHEKVMALEEYLSGLKNSLPQRAVEIGYQLEKNHELLMAFNPRNVLSRGYSYLEDEKHNVISNIQSFKKLKSGAKIYAHLVDGKGELTKS